jgi:hypothetical protein
VFTDSTATRPDVRSSQVERLGRLIGVAVGIVAPLGADVDDGVSEARDDELAGGLRRRPEVRLGEDAVEVFFHRVAARVLREGVVADLALVAVDASADAADDARANPPIRVGLRDVDVGAQALEVQQVLVGDLVGRFENRCHR